MWTYIGPEPYNFIGAFITIGSITYWCSSLNPLEMHITKYTGKQDKSCSEHICRTSKTYTRIYKDHWVHSSNFLTTDPLPTSDYRNFWSSISAWSLSVYRPLLFHYRSSFASLICDRRSHLGHQFGLLIQRSRIHCFIANRSTMMVGSNNNLRHPLMRYAQDCWSHRSNESCVSFL